MKQMKHYKSADFKCRQRSEKTNRFLIITCHLHRSRRSHLFDFGQLCLLFFIIKITKVQLRLIARHNKNCAYTRARAHTHARTHAHMCARAVKYKSNILAVVTHV